MSSIEPGQVYRSADPRGGPRVRVLRFEPGWKRAYVVDARTGKQPRGILVGDLHAEATTAAGKPRRTGYVLEVSR